MLYPPAHTMARERRPGLSYSCGLSRADCPLAAASQGIALGGSFSDRFTTEPERFTYIPFGAGQRICIGAGFAIQKQF